MRTRKIAGDSAMPFLTDWHFSTATSQSKKTFSVPPGYSFARESFGIPESTTQVFKRQRKTGGEHLASRR